MTDQLFENYQNQRWTFVEYNQADVDNVKMAFDVSESLARLLIHNSRSTDIVYIQSLLEPSIELLHSFEGISDQAEIQKAVQRLKKAQKQNEHIFVNGDPDADGISGTAILVAGLRQLGFKTTYLFPIRPVEGHGVQVRIIDEAKRQGAGLLITTDCGTKDIQAINYANSQGIDVIVTDHHILGSTLPNTCALINPNMAKNDDRCRQVAGATVSFKFIQAMYHYLDVEFPDYLFEFGVMVSALGSISDRVSMLDPLNRVLVKYGVDYFFQTEREGLKAIRDISIPNKHLNRPRHLSRTVIPRLNAPGRIGNPADNIPDSTLVVDLMLLGKGKRHKAKANHLRKQLGDVFQEEEQQFKQKMQASSSAIDVDEINEKRKKLTATIEDEMDYLIEKQVDQGRDRIIILQGQDWNSGVIGIDADRLKERFLRPAILLNGSEDSEYVRGSARSIPRINIYQLIDQVEQKYTDLNQRGLFQYTVQNQGKTQVVSAFGGHSQACGFTIHKDDIDFFITEIKAAALHLTADQFEYHYDVVDRITLDKVNSTLIKDLDRFSPYGQHFEFPTFYVEDCELLGGRSFGNRYQSRLKQHVQFSVRAAGSSRGVKFDAVGFGLWEKYCQIKEQMTGFQKIDLIFRAELDPRSKSDVASKAKVRLNVLDFRVSD